MLLDDSASYPRRDENEGELFDGLYDARFASSPTARLDDAFPRGMSGDDLDAIEPEDLGVTFLSRATETDSEAPEDDDLLQLSQVTTPDELLASEPSFDLVSSPPDELELAPESLEDGATSSGGSGLREVEDDLTDIFSPPSAEQHSRP